MRVPHGSSGGAFHRAPADLRHHRAGGSGSSRSSATLGVPHIAAANRTSVLRPGVRAGAGPPFSDGSLAALGSGQAVRSPRREFHRARFDDATLPVPRRHRGRMGELRIGHESRGRGFYARHQRLGRARARAAARGVRARRVGARALAPRRPAEPHGRVRGERQRSRRSAARQADGRAGRRSHPNALSGRRRHPQRPARSRSPGDQRCPE